MTAAVVVQAFCVSFCAQVGHTDKNGQCALVHAALKGHAEIIHTLLGQDWGTEITSDPQLHPNNQNVTLKTQGVQQALTAAASLGHTQARIGARKKKKKNGCF